MAQNKLAGRARYHHQQRRDARQVTGEDVTLAATPRPGPDQVVAGRDLLEALRSRLTPEERELADRRGAGQPWAEIAAALGGTPNARRMQLQRAIDRVAPELGLEEDEEEDSDA
jgi:DNA-directed RNA polymerase specialized sigma24 family protein